jgi:plastocyanin
MQKTTRRHLLRAAAAGGAAAAGIGLAALPRRLSASPAIDENHAHGQPGLEGKKSAATMTFGAWKSNPPLDRFKVPAPPPANIHVVQPNEVDIEAGGTVNIIISGFHLVMVYDDGIEKVNILPTLDSTSPPMPGLIDQPTNRLYRGLDPRFSSPDRVEVVHFAHPGRYLVICGVLPHFNQGMMGYVNVKNPDA